MKYNFSVVMPIRTPSAEHPEHAVNILHTLMVECAQPLQWVRQHADELAQRLGFVDYVALNIEGPL